jgi:hypothetical protein
MAIIYGFRPYIGGGGNLTFDAGAPGLATYWELVGINHLTQEEEAPHGSLKTALVQADAAGLATNVYFAPTDAGLAGHIDRVKVKRLA